MSLARLFFRVIPAAFLGYVAGQIFVGGALGFLPASMVPVPPLGVGLLSGLVGAYLGGNWLA